MRLEVEMGMGDCDEIYDALRRELVRVTLNGS